MDPGGPPGSPARLGPAILTRLWAGLWQALTAAQTATDRLAVAEIHGAYFLASEPEPVVSAIPVDQIHYIPTDDA